MADLLESNPEEYRREASAARASLRADPHRPQYHFTAPCNWLNDPNGLIQWQGRYHLFYQHNPTSPISATKHWGHAVSTDLVHWADLPIALAPIPESADADGVYSGCTVDDHGVPTILYTGVHGPFQRVCVATGDPDLLRWQKDPRNPVVSDVPPGLDLLQTSDGTVHYRDPSVWRDGDTWWMIVGSGVAGVGGTVLLYRSADLRNWEYMHPLLVGDVNRKEPVWTGSMWECPQLFPLGDRHVLLISVWHQRQTHYPAYMVGTYTGDRFTPESVAILDAGSHYAPQTFLDDQGRRILIGWQREQRDRETMAASLWNGAMSVPLELTLGDDRTMRYTPIHELEALRGDRSRVEWRQIAGGEEIMLSNVRGASLELDATIDPGSASAVGLVVRCAPNGAEKTRLVYDREQGLLFVDRTISSAEERADQTRHDAHLTLGAGENIRLRVFLDHSVLEVIANERVILSERIYPTRGDSLGVGVFADGGDAILEALDAWSMKAI